MAKAVYTFLSWPDDVDTKSVELALTGLGLCWMHSPVHSDDVSKKTGEKVKPHIHWYVGFASKPMGVKVFMDKVKAISPAIGCSQKEVVIADPLAAYDYCTHKNNPNKAQYSEDDIVESEGWCLAEYVTATQRKEHEASERRRLKYQNKEDNNEALAEIIKMLGTTSDKIHCFSSLVAWSMGCGKLQLVRENAYFLRSYIDSMCLEARVQYKEDAQIADLIKTCNTLREHNSDLRDRLAHAENTCVTYYQQLYGETAPASYEW